jgi:hypothetical protein
VGSNHIWRSQTLSGIVVWCWLLKIFRAPPRFVCETDGAIGFARTAERILTNEVYSRGLRPEKPLQHYIVVKRTAPQERCFSCDSKAFRES